MIDINLDLKMHYEKQLDRLIKERRELYSLVGEEDYNTPMYRRCYKDIRDKTILINIIKEKWRKLDGLFYRP